MDIKEFDQKIKILLGNFDNPRPFVCSENPLDSDIFIVGFNAATEMTEQFSSFWSIEYGFNKKKWFDCYIQERAIKPLKPGKTRRNKVSNTRQRIEWIIEALKSSKILETNIYVTATPTAKELSAGQMDSTIFEFLVKSIKPKVMLLHGAKVREHLELISNQTIPMNETTKITLFGRKIDIYATSHLSRGWSKSQCSELAQILTKKLSETYI